MRADAELAVGTLARGSQFGRTPWALLAISRWLAGEVEEADDLFAEVVEAGLELGGTDSVTVALGERAAIASEWERGSRQKSTRTGRWGSSAGHAMEEYPTSALAYAVAARVALHRGDAPARRSCWPGCSACGRGSPTGSRTTRYKPAWSSPGPT